MKLALTYIGLLAEDELRFDDRPVQQHTLTTENREYNNYLFNDARIRKALFCVALLISRWLVFYTHVRSTWNNIRHIWCERWKNYRQSSIMEQNRNGFRSELFNYSLDFYCVFWGKQNNSARNPFRLYSMIGAQFGTRDGNGIIWRAFVPYGIGSDESTDNTAYELRS